MNIRKVITISVFVFVSFSILYYLVFVMPQQGKVFVRIDVDPGDATVYVNGGKSSSSLYLRPGSYTFKATKSGWVDATATVTIDDSNPDVALVLEPLSDEAKQVASNDKNAARREGLAGVAAGARGQTLRINNEIINKLPYSDISGPFKIDFGYSEKNSEKVYLIISYSSPNGRIRAVNWLRKNGVNLTNTEVLFKDFVNKAVEGIDE